jgi:two-component system, NarL family, nitrate/nitrite response regulator NarL
MKIVICDGHRVFADALASLLQGAGHAVVGSVVSLEEAAEICGRVQVDACVVDLRPTRTGRRPDIAQALRSAPGTAFVALSASADAATLRQAAAAGAGGLALKGDDFGEFLRVVTDTVSSQERSTGPAPANQVVLSRSARAALRAGQGAAAGPSQFLTEREWEALGRLVRGESTASMARAMGVRVSTARTHIDAVLSKLGAHSRLEAVAYAVREGLVDTSGWHREQRTAGMGEQRAVGI